MSNLLFSLNIVLPIFLIIGTGYAARQIKLLSEKTVTEINNATFRIFLPILIGRNIMGSELNASYGGGVFLFVGVGVTALFLLLFFLIPRIEKDPAKRGTLIQAIGRSNYAIFGVPMVLAIFPDSDASTASLMVAVTIPLYNILSVVALSVFSKEKANFADVIKKVITNPLIIGSLAGLLILKLHIPLPYIIDRATADMAQIASPLALFILGASFRFDRLKTNLRPLIIGIIGKLVVSPLIALTIAVQFGFRGVDLASVMLAFGAPTAVSSFTMAQQMGGDAELASAQVILSTAASAVTMFLFIFVFKQLGYF